LSLRRLAESIHLAWQRIIRPASAAEKRRLKKIVKVHLKMQS
jgi:hypothetical protein